MQQVARIRLDFVSFVGFYELVSARTHFTHPRCVGMGAPLFPSPLEILEDVAKPVWEMLFPSCNTFLIFFFFLGFSSLFPALIQNVEQRHFVLTKEKKKITKK